MAKLPLMVAWFFLFGGKGVEMKIRLIVLIAMLIFLTTSVYAELHDRGGGLIFDDVLNVTWLQDANYAMTSGYDDDGRMTWEEAVEWTEQLHYNGYTGWRLPYTNPVNGSAYNYTHLNDGSSDDGYNISAPGTIYAGSTGSEMAYMFLYELGNLGYCDTSGNCPQEGWGLTNTGPFTNIMDGNYWSATEYGRDVPGLPSGYNAWCFHSDNGAQGYLGKASPLYAWAVRDGDVEPNTYCVSTEDGLRDALIDAAGNGMNDIIQLRQGTYYGNFTYSSTEAYSLTIEGGYKPKPPGCKKRVVYPANTVLDGGATGRVLTLDCSSVAAGLLVDGITLQNGSLASGHGGGIFMSTNQGNALLKNSVIRNNSIGGSGGGVYLHGNETVYLIDNHVQENASSHSGGVISCDTYSVSMIGNTFIDNYAYPGDVGGVSIGSDACGSSKPELVTFSNNVVSNNTASDGNWGGILIRGSNGATITVDNNTIANNSARSNGGGQITGGVNTGVVIFTNNIVSDNIGIEGSAGIRISGDKEVSVKDNFIIGNSAGSLWGFGGITISGTITITLTNNIINNNSGENAPGGVHIDFPSISTESVLSVTNNTICRNTSANYGGGIKIDLENEAQSANVYNNIIWANSATLGSDIYIKNDGNDNGTPSPVNLFNNDFDQSSTGTYIQIPFTIDSSNLDNIDPLFNIDGYHLTDISPCIDAGMDASIYGVYEDIDGDARPHPVGGNYDIGADEYVGTSGSEMLDLDIARFTATKRISVTGKKNTVDISLAVENMGTLDGDCPATVVGMQGENEVHSETINVSDAVGKGPTTHNFTPFTPTTAGDIVWTAIIDDDNPDDVDEATASTTVNP
jgi:hypothetical protein